MTRTFDVLYYKQIPGPLRVLNHQRSETWAKTELFCPRCGIREVWAEQGPGDYYVGASHICTACTGGFYLPDGVDTLPTCEQDAQRLTQLVREET